MKECPICKKEKPLEDFSKQSKSPNGYGSYCKECKNKIDKERYHSDIKYKQKKRDQKAEFTKRNQQFVYEYLLLHPCVDCGETDPIVLEFDHIYGKDKGISQMISKHSLERIKNEIEKCDIRCANCHRRKTARERSFYTYKNANK